MRLLASFLVGFTATTLLASPALAGPPGAAEMEEEKLEEEDAERAARLHIWADAVFGFGKTDVIMSNQPIGVTPLSYRREAERFTSQNFDVGMAYEVIEDLAIGFEIPISHATFSPADNAPRSVAFVGNFELNAEWVRVVAKHWAIVPSLEVALPTAQGEELPSEEEVAADPTLRRALTELDRWSGQRAAENVRGWEENHLFAPGRVGFVPRIGVLYEGIHNLEIEPSAKAGLLVSTKNKPFEGDVVLALRASYRFVRSFDAGLRVWTNIPVGGDLPHDEAPVGVLEPQIRGHWGAALPVLGVVVPFAGPIANPENVGVRLALAGHF